MAEGGSAADRKRKTWTDDGDDDAELAAQIAAAEREVAEARAAAGTAGAAAPPGGGGGGAEGAPAAKAAKVDASIIAAADAASAGAQKSGADGWHWHRSKALLACQYLEGTASEKIAGFDFDGCLASTSMYNKGPDAWKLLYPGAIEAALKGLVAAGYRIVIMSNQEQVGKSKLSFERIAAEKKGRFMGLARKVGVPVLILAACAKADAKGDTFRKPATGMWDWVAERNGGVKIDRERSFFVGDAAGRPKRHAKAEKGVMLGVMKQADHSDSDKKLAAAAGVRFYTDDAFFVGEQKGDVAAYKALIAA